MVSRTTDDYQQMALTGCVAVTEPAFWAGWDRSGADGFEDYFRQLTEFEPARAGQYRIQHYTWMAMNPKEADDRELSRAVLARIPKFLDRPTVIGIGEIGLNRITRNPNRLVRCRKSKLSPSSLFCIHHSAFCISLTATCSRCFRSG